MARPETHQPFLSPENESSETTFIFERGDPPQRLLEEQPGVLELQPFKEIWVPTFNVFTASGHPGSGKSLQTAALAYCYNIENVTPSQEFRAEIEKMGQQVRGKVIRPEEMDKKLDENQLKLIQDTIKNDSSILLESRLGGVIATEYLLDIEKKRQRNKSLTEPRIIRGLWVANRDERARRVAERDGTSIEQARRDTTEREQVDFSIWRKHHPKVLKNVQDVYDPKLVYKPGRKNTNRLHGSQGRTYLYDFMIRTSHQTFNETFMEIHTYLAENGLILKVDETYPQVDRTDFNPNGGDIAILA